ncbi:AMP-dependent synthetase/ligase [Pseudonocardia spinosispora]|uniref:AMP-dependent synthetase/ligase n=1 Tax=Pseudonocardia spinosispora TaxID=103441 RepID=UPI000424183D|nr:long-chain fatty acid--CoA ligase [Pseudonocardia spinosispora]
MTGSGTLLQLIDRNATEYGDVPATVDGDSRLTWAQYRARARAIALALLDLGVRPGEVVGLHMINRAEHVQADIGALLAGATPTSYYQTLAADQLAYVARDSAAVVAIVDADQLPLWLEIRDQLPDLRHLVVLDQQDPPEGVRRFDQLIEAAESGVEQRGAEVDAASATVGPDSVLTIVYTSGTTGHPKGTIITHGGVLHVMNGFSARSEEGGSPLPLADASAMSYLPLAHIAERMFSHYLALRQASTVTYIRDYRQMASQLPVVRPHVFLGVPRIWEKIYGTIRERASTESSPVKRTLAATAIDVAKAYGQARMEQRSPDLRTRLLHPVLEKLAYQKIRAALGMDRVVMSASGAAPLSNEVLTFFLGIGIPITEAYGMTETSAVLTATPVGAPRLGSVGKPMPGVDLRIAADGEIIARGPNITPGYLNRPEATAEAIDADGWLHTGDLGSIDADGYLFITGRKKELIINAAGKNISPANVELAVSSASDLLGPVYVYGDNRPYLVALLTLDPMSWQDWCKTRGITAETAAEAVENPDVIAEANRAVEAGNARLARVEQVKRWTLLPDVWDSTTGELTPTLKLKRPVVTERYQADVDKLYS